MYIYNIYILIYIYYIYMYIYTIQYYTMPYHHAIPCNIYIYTYIYIYIPYSTIPCHTTMPYHAYPNIPQYHTMHTPPYMYTIPGPLAISPVQYSLCPITYIKYSQSTIPFFEGCEAMVSVSGAKQWPRRCVHRFRFLLQLRHPPGAGCSQTSS